MTLGKYSKAIVGAAVAGLGWLALRYGIQWDPTMEAAATTLVTGVLVWLVPNQA